MKKLLSLTLFCGCCFSAVAQQQEFADWKSQGRHQVGVGWGWGPLGAVKYHFGGNVQDFNPGYYKKTTKGREMSTTSIGLRE